MTSFICTTTMQNRSTFSYQSTTGFISAATVNESLQIRKSAADKKRISSDSVAQGKGDHIRIRPTKTDEGQGTLLEFWKKQKPEAATLGNASAHISSTSLPVISRGLEDHKLRSIANSSRPCLPVTERSSSSNHYVFLSSSPPRFTNPQENNTISDVPIVGFRSMPTIDRSEPKEVDDSHFATSLHTTSLAQLRATSDPPKKTLGVRRSMTGWQPRRNQGFSIPSRTTNLP